MGNYVRAFCTAQSVPSVNTVLADLEQQGITVTASADDPTVLESPLWEQFVLVYREDGLVIPVACYRNEGDDSPAQEEIARALATLGFPYLSRVKRRVIAHLKATRFVICSLLLSETDDGGLEATHQFLSYFGTHCGGLIHTDTEGFLS